MNSIVLLTAMTATSGLFGGARHHKAAYAPAPTCQSGRCGAPASYAPSCQTGRCGIPAYAPAYAPAPAPVYAPAPAAQAPAPRVTAAPAPYQSYYFTAGAPSACATGNCPRR